jgi:hypothetical protein
MTDIETTEPIKWTYHGNGNSDGERVTPTPKIWETLSLLTQSPVVVAHMCGPGDKEIVHVLKNLKVLPQVQGCI